LKKVKDFYFHKAKKENYLARSVYKLQEIDQKYHLIKKGYKILDIGCAPGSWTQYMLKKIKAGLVVGIDLCEKIKVSHPRFIFIKGDILELTPKQVMEKAFPEKDKDNTKNKNISHNRLMKFDLIVSDAAPQTIGDTFSDTQYSLEIVKKVFEIADKLLKKGGSVVAKVFQGEDLRNFTTGLISSFEKVKQYKPKSSRKESREIYIIALNKLLNN